MRQTILAFFVVSTAVWGQNTPWDSTGNRLLNGRYNFRQLHLETATFSGTYSRRIAIWGQMTFDGNGKYTIDARVLDSSSLPAKPFTTPGTYTISSSGFGFLDSPALANALTFGLVSQGIFIGSSTESEVYDLFIAAPVSTTTTAQFSGQYWVSDLAYPDPNGARTRDVFFQISPNGSGALGNIAVSSFSNTPTRATQTVMGATYAFGANGIGTLTYPASSTYVLGSKTLYTTPDRKFIFGGSESTWDMFVGVVPLAGRATQSSVSGLFYTAGLEQNNSDIATSSIADSYYGSTLVLGTTALGHQRLLVGTLDEAIDYTFSDVLQVAADGSWEDFLAVHNVVGADGNIMIGYGTGTVVGLTLGLKSPVIDSPGVFVDPTGILNAASYSPFTSGISRGELIRIFGSGLAPRTRVDSTFPTTLEGVRVSINNLPAPIFQVSSSELVVQVPWATQGPVASIQVTNGTVASNVATTYLGATAPGVFSQSQDGVGSAAALHANFSLVSQANPARPGETIQVYLTGLGSVRPPVADGAPGPSAEPLARASENVSVQMTGSDAPVAFAGLAPGFIGLYQLNVTIPTGTATGLQYMDILSAGAQNSQIQVPVVRPSGSSGAQAVQIERPRTRRLGPATPGFVRWPLSEPIGTPRGLKFPHAE